MITKNRGKEMLRWASSMCSPTVWDHCCSRYASNTHDQVAFLSKVQEMTEH